MKTISMSPLSACSRLIAIIVSLLLIGAFSGCQKEGSAEKAGQKLDRSMENAEQKLEQMAEKTGKKIEETKQTISEKTESSGQYLDDSVVTLNVKTAIVNEPLLKVSEISVTTENGVVQLNGTVDSQQISDKAVEVARVQKGVKSVLNNLTIRMVNSPQ
ncbi:BON domain-containing protein [Nitrosomonas sp. JL21]|uniref:BON domain-containing protein n=1 Tax=Nitrosomonas sp. JL21 TaxID=153949 RepID=UPI00136B6644|nr:BON domain-containing protein [Nitrosomonas sp. JL21]MXS77602.1 BON domain-containing protein [Nitrosomonas sp. JL21]